MHKGKHKMNGHKKIENFYKYIHYNTIEKFNTELLATFLAIIIFDIAMLITSFMGNHSSTYTTFNRIAATPYFSIIVTLVPTVIGFITKRLLKIPVGSQDDAAEDEKKPDEPNIIQRKTLYEKLKACVFADSISPILFTGKSGAGKSTLLKTFKKSHSDETLFIEYYTPSLNIKDQTSKNKKTRMVILDQFERALSHRAKVEEIMRYCEEQGLTLILSFRQDYLAEVLKFVDLEKANSYRYFPISNIKEEVELMDGQLRDNLNFYETPESQNGKHNENEQKKNRGEFISTIKQQLNENQISFIEWARLEEMIGVYTATRFIERYKSVEKNPNPIISMLKDYIEFQIDKIERPHLAHMFLYLICLDDKSKYMNLLIDFQNISFCDEKSLGSIIERLKKCNFIREVTDNTDELMYEVVHDFIRETALQYEMETLNPEIRRNIDYYHNNVQCDRGGTRSPSLHSDYDDYMEGKSSIALNAALLMILLFIIGAHAFHFFPLLWQGFIGDFSSVWGGTFNESLAWLLLSMAAAVSTFYTYNTYGFFFKIRKYTKMYFGAGMLAIVMSYPFPTAFGIWYGAAIISVGLHQWFLCLEARSTEKRFFKNRFICFTLIGVAVASIGLCLFHMKLGATIFLFMGLYCAFLLFCINSHIKESHRLAVMGKFMFKEGKENRA